MKPREVAAEYEQQLQKERTAKVYGGILLNVEKHGWSAMGVFPTDHDPPETLPFMYSIGLPETYNHPEIIVIGLGTDAGHGVLTSAVDWVKNNGPLPLGEPVTEILANGYDPVFIRATAPQEPPLFPSFARWFAGYRELEKVGDVESPIEPRDVDLIQLVYPDPEHRFPWDNAAETMQPLLGHAPVLCSACRLPQEKCAVSCPARLAGGWER